MKSNRKLTFAVVCFSCLVYGTDAMAVTISVNNEGSFTQQTITVNPDDTFSIDINVNTQDEIFDVYDMKLSANVNNVLSLTGGFIHSSWTSFDTLPVGNLDPVSEPFKVNLPYPDMFGPGETTLMTLEIHVASGTSPGTYSLNLINAKYTECRICPAFSNVDSGSEFVVEVFVESGIPALGEWGLVAMTIILLTAGTLILRRE